MNYYKDLIAKLKFEMGTLYDEDDYQAELYGEAADAIEELSCMIEKNMHVVENLKDSQHYSGRYIKSIMGVKKE